MKIKGKVFIIAGPSGVGKNTIIFDLFRKFKTLEGIPTYTTRPSRADDHKHQARISVTEEEFREMTKGGEFIEWKKIHNFFYGKKIDDARKILDSGKNLLLEIDVQGLKDYREKFTDVCAIFISYESLDKLKTRLQRERPDITTEDLEVRYQTALNEMNEMNNYDFIVTNVEGRPEIAINKVEEIVRSKLL